MKMFSYGNYEVNFTETSQKKINKKFLKAIKLTWQDFQKLK